MANIVREGKGSWAVRFYDDDGSRKAIRGRFNKRIAEMVRVKVEAILAARRAGVPLDAETSSWLGAIDSRLYDKLANAGLVEEKARLAARDFLGQWLTRKLAGDIKPSAGATLKCVIEAAQCYFGKALLAEIQRPDIDRYVEYLRGRGLRPATVHKHVRYVRQAFREAVERGLLDSSPWQFVRVSAGNPTERRAYVPAADAIKCIEAAPNAHWRLLIALARFGGLRIPSEAFSLTWGHVDWERGRLVVPSPKTERCGKAFRVLPMFPTLRPYLEEAFELAKPGDMFVFPEDWRKRAEGPRGWVGVNLRTSFQKIIVKAGLAPWPRLWHSLRASCESDLAGKYPLAVVTKWLGNTPSVALRHYVDPTDSAYQAAVETDPFNPENRPDVFSLNPGPQPRAEGSLKPGPYTFVQIGTEQNKSAESLTDCEIVQNLAARNMLPQKDLMGGIGLEPTTSTV